MCGESCIRDLLQFLLFILILLITTPLLGSYMAKVFGAESLPGERLIYRVLNIDPSDCFQRDRSGGYVSSAFLSKPAASQSAGL
ncbi:hypothetical protein HTH_0189 [Hydrogenobacter thermophilus TK-6]|uniref:Uncharacterized protein n=1 Tax=Hydrogenobacter thermophilus (strain DSM 6534 / IAM 12695 / TK-6) TaxID=608538 RepID=D3DFQ4_HYDTT|nr:hypothetical protein [Hydrogenobacter thermophilus]BAI68656.1 hypothetical protein HTH_0189 [Hydrogenobacter thermophilus TK-6]